jgi:hypothetical protein
MSTTNIKRRRDHEPHAPGTDEAPATDHPNAIPASRRAAPRRVASTAARAALLSQQQSDKQIEVAEGVSDAAVAKENHSASVDKPVPRAEATTQDSALPPSPSGSDITYAHSDPEHSPAAWSLATMRDTDGDYPIPIRVSDSRYLTFFDSLSRRSPRKQKTLLKTN